MIKLTLPLVMLVATPVAAQEFSLPQGCDGYLTIQSTSCTVSHYFRCTDDTDGQQRRATLDEDGLSYVGRISKDAEWLESFHLRSGHTERLLTSEDTMSISTLLSEMVDTFNFVTDSREIGRSNYVGMDRLTGESVVIDGITLLRTEFEVTAFDDAGNQTWKSEGSEFVNPDWNMFIGGTSSFVTSTDRFDNDNTPIEFIFPGEPGYLSVNPKYGCGMQLSSYDDAGVDADPVTIAY